MLHAGRWSRSIKWSPAWFKPFSAVMAANPKFFPALTVLGLGAGVAGEFADDDPIARNALQSVGVVGAGLAGQQLGTVLGGILGAPLGPVGAFTGAGIGRFVGGGLGTAVGTQLGSNVMGGLYDAVTGSSQKDRDLEALPSGSVSDATGERAPSDTGPRDEHDGPDA